jgi:hypothetical protein
VYPDTRVASYITQNFIPVKIHIKEQHAAFDRFGVQWTPTLLILDPQGRERYRFEGYLPPEDFLAQLHLGLARAAFANQQWNEAKRRYRQIVEQYPKTETAAEALYWAVVARYKASGDAAALKETAHQFQSRYTSSAWAKKASVWAA